MVGDQERAGNLGRDGDPLGQARSAVEAATGEAPADARHLEDVEVGEQRLRRRHDRVEAVAPEENREIVRFQDRLGRIARKADRVEQDAHRLVLRLRRPPIDRDVLVGRPGHVAAKVRQAPRDRDPHPGRGRRVGALQPRERILERRLRVAERPAALPDLDRRGDELVVERRNDDLDAVVLDDPDTLEQVLLLGRRPGRGPAPASRRVGRRARTALPRPDRQRRRRRAAACA